MAAIRRGLACLVFVVGATLGAAHTGMAQDEQPAEVAPDALESWRRLGTPSWRFDSTGVEAGPEETVAFLVSDTAFDDFRIDVEFWVADDTNSGLFIRCGEIRAIRDLNPDNCYEVNIWDNHPNQAYRTGSIVKRAAPVGRADSLGHWNRLEVIARDATISVRVNGELISELDDAETRAGPVALQYAGKGLLRFRNFDIREN